MRLKSVIALVCLGLLNSACSSLDALYLREGIGTELSSPDIAQASYLQDVYVGEICRQAGLRVIRQAEVLYCNELSMRPSEWATFVQAGMNDIDRRCDAYLAWIDNKRRWREPILKQINATSAATAAILGLTGVGAVPIAIVGTAFGLAQDTFVNFQSRLITEIDQTVVQSVVLGNQNEFRYKLANVPINNRPAAIYILRNYLRICAPFSIETSINSTITTYQRAGVEGLARMEPMLTRAPTVAQRTAISVAQRTAISPRDKIARPPRVVSLPSREDYRQIISNFNPRVHTISTVEPLLLKLCVPDAELRAIGERTKLLIKIYQLATNANVTGKLTRAQLRRINNLDDCGAGRLNYYEAHVMKNGVVGAVDDLNLGLADSRKLRPDATEVEIRSRIPELRSKLMGKLKLQSPLLDNQITSDLIGELRKLNL